jgi:hypothetical protein
MHMEKHKKFPMKIMILSCFSVLASVWTAAMTSISAAKVDLSKGNWYLGCIEQVSCPTTSWSSIWLRLNLLRRARHAFLVSRVTHKVWEDNCHQDNNDQD